MVDSATVQAAIAERKRRQAAGTWVENRGDPEPENVAAGQATGFGRTMSNAESTYRRQIEQGYDPTTPRNALASAVEQIPFIPMRWAGNAIRDDRGDLGRQPELEWADAKLRMASGAAAPESEKAQLAATYFPAGGQPFEKMDPQMTRARETEYGTAVIRAGGALPKDRAYGQILPKQNDDWWNALPAAQRKAAHMYKGSKAPTGTSGNPTVPANQAAYEALEPGTVYLDPNGVKKRKK